MKKIFYLLITILIAQNLSLANYHDIYIADIQYDWIRKKDIEQEAIINEVRVIIFENPVEKQIGFKKDFKDKLKDKSHVEHYMAASAGHKKYGDFNISAFVHSVDPANFPKIVGYERFMASEKRLIDPNTS